MKKTNARRNLPPIKIWVTDEEKKIIANVAKLCGLSLSAFARSRCLGYHPINRLELQHMEEIFRLHADIGRVGGLLKMLLTNDERMADPDCKALKPSIPGLIEEIKVNQNCIKALIATISGKRKG